MVEAEVEAVLVARSVSLFLKHFFKLLIYHSDTSKVAANSALPMPLKITKQLSISHPHESSFIFHTTAANCVAYTFHVLVLKYIIYNRRF